MSTTFNYDTLPKTIDTNTLKTPNTISCVNFLLATGVSKPTPKIITDISLDQAITTIQPNTCLGFSNLSNITIPYNVNNIGSNAFGYCFNYKKL